MVRIWVASGHHTGITRTAQSKLRQFILIKAGLCWLECNTKREKSLKKFLRFIIMLNLSCVCCGEFAKKLLTNLKIRDIIIK